VKPLSKCSGAEGVFISTFLLPPKRYLPACQNKDHVSAFNFVLRYHSRDCRVPSRTLLVAWLGSFLITRPCCSKLTFCPSYLSLLFLRFGYRSFFTFLSTKVSKTIQKRRITSDEVNNFGDCTCVTTPATFGRGAEFLRQMESSMIILQSNPRKNVWRLFSG
jgi:hypothetical protein